MLVPEVDRVRRRCESYGYASTDAFEADFCKCLESAQAQFAAEGSAALADAAGRTVTQLHADIVRTFGSSKRRRL